MRYLSTLFNDGKGNRYEEAMLGERYRDDLLPLGSSTTDSNGRRTPQDDQMTLRATSEQAASLFREECRERLEQRAEPNSLARLDRKVEKTRRRPVDGIRLGHSAIH